jgi:hypothetical protein
LRELGWTLVAYTGHAGSHPSVLQRVGVA